MPQSELNDHPVKGMSPVQRMSLHPSPKLSSWRAFRRCHHAQDGQKLLEVCCREDPGIIHNDLCPSRWNTWQPGIDPRTYCPQPSGIPGSLSSPSTHKRRSRPHISPSVLCPFRISLLQSYWATFGHRSALIPDHSAYLTQMIAVRIRRRDGRTAPHHSGFTSALARTSVIISCQYLLRHGGFFMLSST